MMNGISIIVKALTNICIKRKNPKPELGILNKYVFLLLLLSTILSSSAYRAMPGWLLTQMIPLI